MSVCVCVYVCVCVAAAFNRMNICIYKSLEFISFTANAYEMRCCCVQTAVSILRQNMYQISRLLWTGICFLFFFRYLGI